MTDDLVPTDAAASGSKSESFLERINLPKLIAGPAGEAISRFIAGATDIPAAWMDRYAQGVKDKTTAKSEVSKALTKSVADYVSKDPEIVERAAHAFLAKEIRKQHNKERIAEKVIEELGPEPNENAAAPDDDWLNVFSRLAEDASSDRMRATWAKILTGQIRKSGAFSLSTLRVASELDERKATLFEKWSARTVSGIAIAFPPKVGPEFMELLELEAAGLVTGTAGILSQQTEIRKDLPYLTIGFRGYTVLVRYNEPTIVRWTAVFLTSPGKELYQICQTGSELSWLEHFAREYPKQHVKEILARSEGSQSIFKLWSQPRDPLQAD